jgi:hypothetical protein
MLAETTSRKLRYAASTNSEWACPCTDSKRAVIGCGSLTAKLQTITHCACQGTSCQSHFVRISTLHRIFSSRFAVIIQTMTRWSGQKAYRLILLRAASVRHCPAEKPQPAECFPVESWRKIQPLSAVLMRHDENHSHITSYDQAKVIVL